MLILGIETATFAGSIALLKDDLILSEYNFNFGPKHNEKLVPSIKWLLKDAGIKKEELFGVVVTAGPGSFTSLRVGISTAKALAYSLNIKIASVSSLEVLSMNIFGTEKQICPLINSKKNEIYYGFFKNKCELQRTSGDSFASPEGLCEKINEETIFLGDGAIKYKDLLSEKLNDKAVFTPSNFNTAKASNCAILGREKFLRDDFDDYTTLVPNYLRKSEAEIKRGIK